MPILVVTRVRHHRARVVALMAFVLTAGLSCSRPTAGNITLVPARMNPTGNYDTSNLGAVSFFGEGGLSSSVYLQKGPVKITIGAVGHPEATPVVLVSLEGQRVGELRIDSPETRGYTIAADIEHTGTTTLALSVSKAWGTISTVSLHQGG